MRYIRLDYALTFFIVYIILSMAREIYKDYKLKMNPTDFDSGYKQAIKDVCTKWNTGIGQSTYREHCFIMGKFLQRKIDGR